MPPGSPALARRRGGRALDVLAAAFQAGLPEGRALPEEMWRRRHRVIVGLLGLHVAGIPAFALLRGYGLGHSLLDATPVAVAAALAHRRPSGRRARAVWATVGLVTSSALLTHLSGGVIEMHFHFFVMLSVIAMYNEWLPFLVAVGYVVVHHGLLGTLFPGNVYNHQAAWDRPWLWASIHGGFVLAASAASLVAWRIAEESRARAEVAERRPSEEALEASERRFQKVFQEGPVGMALVDAEYRYVRVNDALTRMLGYSPEELAGMSPLALTHPDDREADAEGMRRLFGGASEGYRREKRYLTKDNRVIWAALSVSLLQEQGGACYALGIVEDITERKAIERMKDEFVSVVSHELRTPLTSIRGSLGLLAAGLVGPVPDKGRRMLDIAVANTDRLVRLVNDILDLERIESGKVVLRQEDCDAAEFVTRAAEEMRPMAEEAGVNLVVEPTPVRLSADRDRMIQVLTNLVSNAVKFSPAGTCVWLTTQRRGDQVLFSVRDQGRGIPGDQLETVFGRFHQVDASDSRQKGGTGLGLAICRSIVQHHGGRIWATSAEGQGSTFTFALPVLLGHAGTARSAGPC